jgi:hypothetical protein
MISPNIPRNAVLLAGLLLLIVVSPSVVGDRAGFLVELMFGLILLGGVVSVGSIRRHRGLIALTVLTIAVRWTRLLWDIPCLPLGALILTGLWLVHATAIIVVHLFRRRDVTVDTILGAIVAYLMAAVAFAFVFEVIELANPGSFSGLPEHAAEEYKSLRGPFLYFSLTCLTTIGYGDIVAVSSLARPLSVLEGVFGQIYLAVMIARLVGMYIARESAR